MNEAAKDPDTRTESLRRVAKNALKKGDYIRAKPMIKSLADALEGDDRAEVLGELARALLDSQSPADRLEGDRTMREAIARRLEELASKLRAELERVPRPLALRCRTMTAGARRAAPGASCHAAARHRRAVAAAAAASVQLAPRPPGEHQRQDQIRRSRS